jgi:small subunit ribosomal protein S17
MPKRRIQGQVVSTKMQKTVVVSVDMTKRHPIYGKLIKNTKRLKARDEMGVAVGDIVIIEEHRPLSKEVTWIVVEKVDTKGK